MIDAIVRLISISIVAVAIAGVALAGYYFWLAGLWGLTLLVVAVALFTFWWLSD